MQLIGLPIRNRAGVLDPVTLSPSRRLQAPEVVARMPILILALPAHLVVKLAYLLVVLGPKPRQHIPFPSELESDESL